MSEGEELDGIPGQAVPRGGVCDGDLGALLARVEAAETPIRWDNPLNADLHLALGWTRELDHEVYHGKNPAPWAWTDPDGQYCAHHVDDATRSLDAAIALCERVLPTIPRSEPYGPWEWRVHGPNRNDAGHCRAALTWPQTTAGAHVWMVGPAYGKTPALALLAAMLKALIAAHAVASDRSAMPRDTKS